MKNLSRILFSLVSVIVLSGLSACNKDDSSDTTPARTRLQLLTDHGWRLSTFLEDGVNMTTAYFTPCELDNIFTFSTSYNYTIDEGASKCNVADPQIIETGTWAFGNNQNMLILDPGVNESDLNILQLDASTFIYEEVNYSNINPADSSVYRVTLVKS